MCYYNVIKTIFIICNPLYMSCTEFQLALMVLNVFQSQFVHCLSSVVYTAPVK